MEDDEDEVVGASGDVEGCCGERTTEEECRVSGALGCVERGRGSEKVGCLDDSASTKADGEK